MKHDLVLRDVRMTVDSGDVIDSSQRVIPPPCPACEAAARERDDLHSLCDRQADILSRVAVALRGPEPPLTRWSHHDLPERAERAIQERDAAYEDARMIQERLQRLIDAEPQRELVTNYKHMYEVETETAQRYYREIADLRSRFTAAIDELRGMSEVMKAEQVCLNTATAIDERVAELIGAEFQPDDLRARLAAECEAWMQQAAILSDKGNPMALGLEQAAGRLRAELRKEAK